MNVEAYAKINLSLDVIRRREDGYHELRSVMQSLSLHDTVEIIKKADAGISVELTNEDAEFSDIPLGEGNLVYKAAALMKERFSIEDGLLFRLTKRIPQAAGLAGGSSDAAAVIRGINDMYCLDLGLGQLMRLGKEIGADVPFCIMGGTALAEGIGEKLTRLKPVPACRVLLVKPLKGVSTKEVYERLDSGKGHFVHVPDTKTVCEAIENGSIKALARSMGNVLESVTIPMLPEIEHIKKKMLELGALGAMMSGSGPTVFGLYSDPELCDKAFESFNSGDNELGSIKVIKTEFYRIKGI